MAETT